MAVSAPADMGAKGDEGREENERVLGMLSNRSDFLVGGIGDSKTADDKFIVDVLLKLLHVFLGPRFGDEMGIELCMEPLS